MANIFSFQLNEGFLAGYAEYLKTLRLANPGKSYKVTISVDLTPDGIGYEVREPPQITIDEESAPISKNASLASSASLQKEYPTSHAEDTEEQAIRKAGSDAYAFSEQKVLWDVPHSISQENLTWYHDLTGEPWSGGQHEWYTFNIARSSAIDLVRTRELYEEGWYQAAHEAKSTGALFYFRKLLDMIDSEHGEWYGRDFEKSHALVMQAIRILEHES